MSVKRTIAAAILLLPIAATALLAKPASAEVIIVRPRGFAPPVVVRPPERRDRFWVPGHWDYTPHGRYWVPGHYDYRYPQRYR